jgi:hypothetical protein
LPVHAQKWTLLLLMTVLAVVLMTVLVLLHLRLLMLLVCGHTSLCVSYQLIGVDNCTVPRPTLILPHLPQGWNMREKVVNKQIGKRVIPELIRKYWNGDLKITIRNHPASFKGQREIKSELSKKQKQ